MASSAPGPARAGRTRLWIGLLLLVGLPLTLRLLPIGHGLPRNYVPDTHAVRNALGMARDRDPLPPINAYSSYPYLLPYLLLPAYAVQFAGGVATGAWDGPQGFARHALERPGDVQLTARVVVALLGTLTTLVVFRAARAAGLTLGAWVAAWLAATGLLAVHFAVQERPWVPMVLFQALAVWAAIVHQQRGSRGSLVACAAAAGLAFATHQAGAFTAGLVGLAIVCAPAPPGSRGRVASLLGRTALAVAAFGAVALCVGYPYFLRYGFTPDADAVGGGGAGGVAIGGQRMLLDFSAHTLTRLTRTFFGYDPVTVALGVAGLVPALLDRRLRPAALFAVLWGGFFLTYHNDHVRYLLPLSVLLALTGGLLVERVWRLRAARPFVLAALAVPLVQALRFDHVLSRTDTRAQGELVLAELPPGARVAIDRYGPDVELDRASLERLAVLRAARGDGLASREAHRLELLRAGLPERGVSAVRIEELAGFDERAQTVTVRPEVALLHGVDAGADPLAALRAVLAAEGATHLLLVLRHPDGAHPLSGLVRDRRPLVAIDPRRAGAARAECVLPMEMDFPLVALWRVERPGPYLALYALQ